MIDFIKNDNKVLAIILRASFKPSNNIHFFTPNEFSQQLAYMQQPAGKTIQPHVHNAVAREVFYTQEVLVIKKGRLRVDLYDEHKIYQESRILEQGDVILLASGGHGFEVIEDIEMLEIKQGPYAGEQDKTRFERIEQEKLVVR